MPPEGPAGGGEGASFVRLSGGRIEYRRIPGNGPVLVFLHEGLGCMALWRDFPDRLCAMTGCAGLVYSRFGYGGSAPCSLPRPLSYMEDEARTVLPELLRALDITDFLLVGHSDGASIAIAYAGGAHPPPRAVVLYAPHVFVEDVSVAEIARARDYYASGDLRRRLQPYHGDNTDCAFRGWCDAWLHPDFRHWSLEPYLAGISVPVLIVQGREDPYGTLEQLRRIAAAVAADCQCTVLSDCGHQPQKERRDACLEATAGFLRAVLTPGA